MSLHTKSPDELRKICARLRMELLTTLHAIKTGHPGGSLSCCEIVTTLYHNYLNVDPQYPQWEDRDRFILSKGHAAPMLYLNLAELGFFPKSDFATLRQLGSHLQGHPSARKTPGVDLSTGPLGLGLSAACGIAAAGKLQNKPYNVFVLLGDGEIQEGGVWEACMTANKFKLDNLIAILDHNGVQLDGTNDEIMPMGDLRAKFSAFGWKVLEADGHQIESICQAVDEAVACKGSPVIILAKTIKGKGISFMEGKSGWHGAPIQDADFEQIKKELEAAAV